ncbi:PPE domain-containing protein [Lentzea sp. NPDC051213]|uniref:PPE domain-containing protein n=1 Tax=Lentzea sp. NPDC051213 TaxID=3364126 RepID=UPI00379B6FD7
MPTETDPIENVPVLTDPQNWASRSHQELYAAVHNGNDPGQAGEISSEWGRYGTELTEAAHTLTGVITASESKWTGAAAEAARDAMKKLADWVDETARTAVNLGDKVLDQGQIMSNARAQMPAPVEFDWNKAAAALSQPGTAAFAVAAIDVALANVKSRAAHEQAVSVMTSMENSSRQIDSSVPTFKPPFNPNTGQVEEPVMVIPRAAGAPTLAGAEGLMSTQTQSAGPGTAPAPSPGPAGNGSYAPAASMPNGGPGGGPGGGGPGAGGPGAGGPGSSNWVSPPPVPVRPDTTALAAASYTPPPSSSYTPQFPPGGGNNTYTGGSDYKPQIPGGGVPYPSGGSPGGPGSTPRSNTPMPKPAIPPNLLNPNTYLPKETNLPKGMPGGGGGGAGGGGAGGGGGGAAAAAAAAAAMKGGGGGFGGGALGGGVLGGAAGAGPTQSGGAAGVAPGTGRPAMPTGVTAPGGATAAGGTPGAGAPGAGAGARGGEDKERKSASYIMGGDLFDVPGEHLPPSVIGAAKQKKQRGPEQS